jgi:predicted PhzF superfamily epimerase YddE/YHI9
MTISLFHVDAFTDRPFAGNPAFVAFQASARGGVVKVRVMKDRALLGGAAVSVAKGELLVGKGTP